MRYFLGWFVTEQKLTDTSGEFLEFPRAFVTSGVSHGHCPSQSCFTLTSLLGSFPAFQLGLNCSLGGPL